MRKNREDKSKKIYVGLSGGVDSSVSAALLKEEGHDVTGVFIRVWEPDFFPCTWREDRQDAMRVCARLNIPFKTLDLEDVYKREVVDYMIAEYKAGRTPNPDVMCNKEVKFGAFLNWARSERADAVATGHYAQIEYAHPATLWAGADREKDQSYFLWTIQSADLPDIIFPVGGLEKEETRRLAKRFNLPTAEKKDSQGLCFIGKLDIKEFLNEFVQTKKGRVVDQSGNEIGEHDGALFYTLGERHGFRITKPGVHRAYYIVGKDMKKNELIVSYEPFQRSHNKKEVLIEKINWIGGEPQERKKYCARIRHRGELLPVCVEGMTKSTATVVFKKRMPLLASGQSLVLYEQKATGLRCVGGGIVA